MSSTTPQSPPGRNRDASQRHRLVVSQRKRLRWTGRAHSLRRVASARRGQRHRFDTRTRQRRLLWAIESIVGKGQCSGQLAKRGRSEGDIHLATRIHGQLRSASGGQVR